MSEVELQQRMLASYGIRVEPEMTRYVLRALHEAGAALRQLPVIGGEAKTGRPVRTTIDVAALHAAAAAR